MQQLRAHLWIYHHCILKRTTKTVKRKNIITLVTGASLIATIAAAFILRPGPVDLQNVEDVKKLIGKHYLLPVDEQPALLTIEDKTKVKSEFLRRAENGDKLIVYKDNKKVILYRPSSDQIIEVGPVSMADISAQQ